MKRGESISRTKAAVLWSSTVRAGGLETRIRAPREYGGRGLGMGNATGLRSRSCFVHAPEVLLPHTGLRYVWGKSVTIRGEAPGLWEGCPDRGRRQADSITKRSR